MNLLVSSSLDDVIGFASLPLEEKAYAARAAELGLESHPSEDGEHIIFDRAGFAIMFVPKRIARVHAVALMEDEEDVAAAEQLGIAVASTNEEMVEAYDQLFQALEAKLGSPKHQGSWSAESLLDDEEVLHRYAAWEMSETQLVLLFNDEGDAHIAEVATVDLRILPRAAADELPDAAQELLGWPVHD